MTLVPALRQQGAGARADAHSAFLSADQVVSREGLGEPMILTKRNGLLVECINPEYCSGIQHVWISDKREGSPTIHQVLVHATGTNLAQAIEKATSQLAIVLLTLPRRIQL